MFLKDILPYGFLLVLLTIGAACIWYVICNEITLRQRINLVKQWFGEAGGIKRYKAVTYDEHLWALFCFKNPMKLYKDKTNDQIHTP